MVISHFSVKITPMLITQRKGFLMVSGWCDLFSVWQKYGMIDFIFKPG
jgi:hypothetical protein